MKTIRPLRQPGLSRRAVSAVVCTAALAVVAAVPDDASASQTIGFTEIGGNVTNTDSQYNVTVYGQDDGTVNVGSSSINVGANQALFVFTNTAVVASAISHVYFQDGHLLGIASIYNNDTTFNQGANPGNLPDGDTLNPPFVTTSDFLADALPPPGPGPGVRIDSSSRSLGILFNLAGGATYDDVLTALQQGFDAPEEVWDSDGGRLSLTAPLGLRVGIFVQSLGDASGGSAHFINGNPGVQAIPEPSTLALGVGCIVPLIVIRLRRRQQAHASEA